jgi:hypothetical protein
MTVPFRPLAYTSGWVNVFVAFRNGLEMRAGKTATCVRRICVDGEISDFSGSCRCHCLTAGLDTMVDDWKHSGHLVLA